MARLPHVAFAAALSLAAAAPLVAADERWLEWFNPELRRVERERASLEQQLAQLGVPSIGQTVAEYGYQHPLLDEPPRVPAWVQIDLGEAPHIDCIAVIPAISNWQSYGRAAYGFPLRWRVELSDDPEFATATPVRDFTAGDYPNPGAGPVVIPLREPASQRYLRITVTKMAFENERYFYALAEVMALSGNFNVAHKRPVRESSGVPRLRAWIPANLVDGRTPLGPPIRTEYLRHDGFRVMPEKDVMPEFTLDLGRVYRLQEIRLHPIHARNGGDTPGVAFPGGFRLESARSADFRDRRLLRKHTEFSNPGNNPVIVPGRDASARYVRVITTGVWKHSLGFAEIEVYAGGRNVAREATISATPDRAGRPERWPESLLNDGFASYGRLIEWREWLGDWEHRRELTAARSALEQRRRLGIALARQRGWWLVGSAATAGAAVAGGLLFASRRKRRRELTQLRTRIARDLHDEIGSNLAGIAALSEVAGAPQPPEATRAHLAEIQRAARETNSAMREVLWLVGGREEAGADLLSHLRLAAGRLLAGKEVRWTTPAHALPPECSGEAARQVFLICKETMTNIARHSRATRVEISVRQNDDTLAFEIADNGRGFDPEVVRRGLGLTSQQNRAAALAGRLELDARPGGGVRMRFEFPLRRRGPAWPRRLLQVEPSPRCPSSG